MRRVKLRIPPTKVVFEKKDRVEILSHIDECLTTGMLAQGKYVGQFEKEWAEYVGAPYAIACSSGGSALEILMWLLDVKDKEVLIPTITFAATAIAVSLAGGKVRFVDIDPRTFSLSLDEIKRRVTPKTTGVIIVHIGGIITPEIEEIATWCAEKGLWLVEDSAHAHGSEILGRKAGNFGIAGAFSFFATKTMTTAEGGMIITHDQNLAERAKLARNYGKAEPWVSYHTHFGSNWRMSELNAVLGLTQLARLEASIAWRQKIANIYTNYLKGAPQARPILPSGKSSWYKYIVLLDKGIDKKRLKRAMEEEGVSLAGEVYDIPLHLQPVFKSIAEGDFPHGEDVARRHICLPLYYGMSQEESEYVVGVLRRSLEG